MSEVLELIEAELNNDSLGQHITLPPQLRLDGEKVYIGRRSNGEIFLTQEAPKPRRSLQEIFADIDADPFPDEFMRDRDGGVEAERESL